MVSPMCQYSCDDRDGHATDWHQVHLGSRAVGGAGIVMTEATAVEARGRISPEDLGIWDDDHIDSLSDVTAFIKSQGSVPAIQLAHAGWKASTVRPRDGHDTLTPEDDGWTVVGPTTDSFPYDRPEPDIDRLDSEEIADIVTAFGRAAERAVEAGFEIVEVHAAHGYLLHQFLSPVTNTRDDEYGGDFEGRTRFTREATAEVRERIPEDVPVFVRISSTDWLPNQDSWTVDSSIRLTDRLADLGADLVDVSSGGISPDSYPEYQGPNYQLPHAERIRAETEADILVGTVGGITTPEQAEAIVANGRADLAIVGREHLRDPYFGLRAADALGVEEVEGPPQYRELFRN
jgi:2,4-dienoyl-CoA reductase-like NADH-dependent reductase (Old Yellow Enzyme family)